MIKIRARKRESEESPNRIRQRDNLPAVLYGPTQDSINLKLNKKEVQELLNKITRSTRIELKLSQEAHKVFLKDIQYDHLKDEPIHLDFYETPDDYPVKMEIPIVTVGTPEGVSSGGIMDQTMETISVEGKARDIPELLRLDVENLQIGDSIHISDLEMEDIQILNPPDRTVLSILSPRKEIEIDLTEPTIGEELLAEEGLSEEEEEELEEPLEEELEGELEGEEEELEGEETEPEGETKESG